MTDRRVTPDPALVKLNDDGSISAPVVDLLRNIGGPRDRQLLFGDDVTILNRMDSHALVRAAKDGYCGWIASTAIAARKTPSHRVTARATHAYTAADFKSPDRTLLSYGSRLTALSEHDRFIETDLGFIPAQHLEPNATTAADPAEVAALFLGTPYLWGGNSCSGIDCSGLVQVACLACGLACPGDSDQQEHVLGISLAGKEPLRRNDLVFWKGHVALVTDDNTLIHANAHDMGVAYEPIAQAIQRINAQGDGLPTSRKRLPAFDI